MDFGLGIHTTSSIEQAENFTQSLLRKNRGQGVKTVSIYEFDSKAFKALKIMDFEKNLDNWFDYVEMNRPSGNDKYFEKHYKNSSEF